MFSRGITLARGIRTIPRINKAVAQKRLCTESSPEKLLHEKDTQLARIYSKYAALELELCKARSIMSKMARGFNLDATEREDLDESLRKYRLQREEDMKEDQTKTMRKMDELMAMMETVGEENKKLHLRMQANASVIKKIEDEVEPLGQKLEELNDIMDRNTKY